MRRAAQPRGARRADRVLRWADRVPRGDRGHLAAQHCADVHGAPDSGGDAVRHLRAPQAGSRSAAPDLHRPDRGGRRVRAAGLRRLPARPKVPGDRGDLGERLGAVYPVFGFPARAAPDHLHHQRRGEPELPAPEDHQEPGALPQRRRRDQAAVAGHPRHRRQTRPPTGQGERPATDPAHRARSAGRRRHRAGLESRPRRAGFGLPRPARRLPHLTPFLRHGHSFPPRRRSPRGAPAAQRGRTTWTPTSGGRRSTAEEISTADRFTYTDILTSSAGQPEQVKVHDVIDPALGKANPYGVDDLAADTGWVSGGTDHDPAAFAGEPIRRWWASTGPTCYPHASRLLITADGGGSNGYRTRLWKTELAALATDTGLQITVCHLPPGTSKWNKIEHRLFSHISMNWRGRPLTSHDVIVASIAATTTRTGLSVHAELDTATYPTGVKIPDAQMNALRDTGTLRRHDWHPEWNYTLNPPRN